jgi:adenylate kinase family enzyme
VLVVGSGGAGKSTLAAGIGARTGLPVIHLDAHHWQPGWAAPPKDVWAATVTRLTAAPAWVMDGNFSGTLSQRLTACDTVLWLDLPRRLCLWRALRRRVRYRGRTRPDMAPGCPERFDFRFFLWIWTFPAQGRRRLQAKLSARPPGVRLVVLRTRWEVAAFLASLPAAVISALPDAPTS